MSQLTNPIFSDGAIVFIVVTLSGTDLLGLESKGEEPPLSQRILALVDTGANRTCLHPMVLRALGLLPTGMVEVSTPLTGAAPDTRGRYEVALMIPSRLQGQPPLVVDALEVVSAELPPAFGVDALLGRDVLEKCLLVYHGPERRYTLAY